MPQAVALVFDHALITPKAPSPESFAQGHVDTFGREAVPVALLNDIVSWCSGEAAVQASHGALHESVCSRWHAVWCTLHLTQALIHAAPSLRA